MKKSTFKNKSKVGLFIALFLLAFSFAGLSSCFAQVQNNGNLFIGNTGIFYVQSGAYNFGTAAITKTNKLPTTNYGTLGFGPNATFSGTANAQYLDGYARFFTANAAGTLAFTSGLSFTFPVGDQSIYAPASITATASITNNAVDCAYYRANPTAVGTALDASVAAISTLEYWNIKGSNNAIISLTWRASSNLSSFVAPVSNLTIAGYDGTKWVEVPSTLTGTIATGTISTNSAVDLTAFQYFTLAARGNTCAPLVASSGVTRTWNGTSWSPSAPTITDPVVLTGNYPSSGGSFACNSLAMGAFNITLTNGQSLEIVNGVTGSGKVIMSSQASVVQRAGGIPGPNVVLTKTTTNKRQFDYEYWGTPIAGDFFSQLAAAQASTAPAANAFDLFYKYVSGTGGGWQVLTATETGKGYIARVRQQAPFTTPTATDVINMTFTGVANNGDITVPITNNPTSLDGGTSHILLANPYPSAIDGDKFLVENDNIDGVIYVWTSATSNPGTVTNYTQADYLAYTKAGTTVPSGITPSFDGKIASGQGFKVKSLANSGNVTFNNCMRLTANNTNFYKGAPNFSSVTSSTSEQPKDRYKVNMTGENGVFSQILIAYLPETTLGYDRLYDAGRNSVSTAQLYSIMENDGRKLAINARPPFLNTDVVPLGVSKSNEASENFTMTIVEKEGVFATGNTNVFVHDIPNNTYHNLNNGPFTFTSNSKGLNARFELVYQETLLQNPNATPMVTAAYIKNQTFNVQANSEMQAVQLFDLTGRLIQTYEINAKTQYSNNFNHAQALYIAKIKFVDGTVSTQKIINQ